MKIPPGEVLRYLKMGGVAANERLSALIGELTDTFAANAAPKNVYGIWDCAINSTEAPNAVIIEGMTVKSESLSRHLAGCHRAVLLAATLGAEADTLLRRYSVQDMGKAVIGQAVCAAMIEAYCDEIENEITESPLVSGLCRTTRFSPGYGDFDITCQKDIVRLLNSERRIGLTLTGGLMLVPSKSVTAVIGFSEEKIHNEVKCNHCIEKSCEFRELSYWIFWNGWKKKDWSLTEPWARCFRPMDLEPESCLNYGT